MTGNIIKLDDHRPDEPVPGNGARAAIDRFMDQHMLGPQLIGHSARYMLAWLWQEGFKVVPLGEKE